MLIKIRIKRHKCLHPFSSLLIAIYELTEHLYLSTQTVCDNIDRRHDTNVMIITKHTNVTLSDVVISVSENDMIR